MEKAKNPKISKIEKKIEEFRMTETTFTVHRETVSGKIAKLSLSAANQPKLGGQIDMPGTAGGTLLEEVSIATSHDLQREEKNRKASDRELRGMINGPRQNAETAQKKAEAAKKATELILNNVTSIAKSVELDAEKTRTARDLAWGAAKLAGMSEEEYQLALSVLDLKQDVQGLKTFQDRITLALDIILTDHPDYFTKKSYQDKSTVAQRDQKIQTVVDGIWSGKKEWKEMEGEEINEKTRQMNKETRDQIWKNAKPAETIKVEQSVAMINVKQPTEPIKTTEPKKKTSEKQKKIACLIIAIVLAAGAAGTIAYLLYDEATENNGNHTAQIITTPTTTGATGTPDKNTVYFAGIPVPSNLDQIQFANLNSNFPQGQWINPDYNPAEADAAHNWEGIGPHYPEAFKNIDQDAAHLSTHGNVGETVVVSDKGGKVMVAFMQENNHQKDGDWGTDQNGNMVKDNVDDMQYTFHSLIPNEQILVVDPDTGKQLSWPDGSPVIYTANSLGIAAFDLPATIGKDVRVAFIFYMPAQVPGVNPQEVLIQRGANNHPENRGVNPLPVTVIKPEIPGN